MYFPLIECSSWADEITQRNNHDFNKYEFEDLPFIDDGGNIADYKFVPPETSLSSALMDLESWLKKEDGYE